MTHISDFSDRELAKIVIRACRGSADGDSLDAVESVIRQVRESERTKVEAVRTQ